MTVHIINIYSYIEKVIKNLFLKNNIYIFA